MKVLALALADEAQRFVKGYPPKGARFLLHPNLEICRLASMMTADDDLRYLDERVETLEPDGTEDIVLCHVSLTQEDPARQLAARLGGVQPIVFFGPQATVWGDKPPDWVAHYVVGDITSVWPEIRSDAQKRVFKPKYRAGGKPGYIMPRQGMSCNPELLPHYQGISFVRGCFCPDATRAYCPEYLYYGTNHYVRTPEEIVGEVISLPGKRIRLLDDDVARFPDYYYGLFQTLWNYRRQWIVNASDQLFEQPRLIRLLAKAGVRIIFLNESFLGDRLERAQTDDRTVKSLYRRVKSIQAAKMLVGARVTIRIDPGGSTDFEPVASVLRRIDLDLIDLRFAETGPYGADRLSHVTYSPMVSNHEPGHIKNRFYAMEAIVDRLARRPRRVGFYTTAVYLLPWSMAYRQNFLEGLPYP